MSELEFSFMDLLWKDILKQFYFYITIYISQNFLKYLCETVALTAWHIHGICMDDSVTLIDDEEESTLISQEYAECTKSIIRQNAFSLKCAPCGIVLENKYYSGSTLMFLKFGKIWLHFDDFVTIREKNRLDVSVIEFYLHLVIKNVTNTKKKDFLLISMTESAKLFDGHKINSKHFKNERKIHIIPIYDKSLQHFKFSDCQFS